MKYDVIFASNEFPGNEDEQINEELEKFKDKNIKFIIPIKKSIGTLEIGVFYEEKENE